MNSLLPHERLIDKRTGLITALVRMPIHPNLPRQLSFWEAHVCDGRLLTGMPSDRVAGGAYFNDDRARMAAIGEAVERYCGNWIDPACLIYGSYAELRSAGYRLLDPLTVPLYSHSQYSARGFPFRPFTRDLRIAWTEGVSLTTGLPTWLPASLLTINYYVGDRAAEPKINFPVFAGISCGQDRESTLLSALLELIERDAIEIWWRCQATPQALNLSQLPALQSWLYPQNPDSPIHYKAFLLRTEFDIPVASVLLHDPIDHIACMGTASRFQSEEALLKAAAEGGQLYCLARQMLEEGSPLWRGIRQGLFNPSILKPFRADRSYREAYRKDWRDMVDLYNHTQYYLDPAAHADLEPYLNAADTASFTAQTTHTASVSHIVRKLEQLGMECFAADLTTSDIADIGWSVQRVLVPGLVLNGPAAFPFLGSSRLTRTPEILGWRDRTLTESELRLAPIPHS